MLWNVSIRRLPFSLEKIGKSTHFNRRGHKSRHTGTRPKLENALIKESKAVSISNLRMVGERGFEPPTPWSRTRCSTRLSHSPIDRLA